MEEIGSLEVVGNKYITFTDIKLIDICSSESLRKSTDQLQKELKKACDKNQLDELRCSVKYYITSELGISIKLKLKAAKEIDEESQRKIKEAIKETAKPIAMDIKQNFNYFIENNQKEISEILDLILKIKESEEKR